MPIFLIFDLLIGINITNIMNDLRQVNTNLKSDDIALV